MRTHKSKMAALLLGCALLLTLLPVSGLAADAPQDLASLVEFSMDFDGNTKDGNGNTVAGVGAVEFGEGKSGQAMKFTNGNYLDLGKLGLENGKTLGMWIKTTKYTSSDPALFGNKSWSNGKADGLLLTYKDAASYRVNIGNAGSSRLDEFPTYTKGSWQYITLVTDPAAKKLLVYSDGYLFKSMDLSAFAFQKAVAGSESFKLGNDGKGEYGGNKNTNYEFYVDDLKLFGAVLTQAQIQSVVSAYKAEIPSVPEQFQGRVETSVDFENDLVPNRGNVTGVSGTTSFVAGRSGGKAAKFTAGNYLDFGNVDFSAGKSIGMWINMVSFTASQDPVIFGNSNWNAPAGNGMILSYRHNNATDYNFHIGDTASASRKDLYVTYPKNQWCYLTVTVDPVDKKAAFYLNGSLMGVNDLNGFQASCVNGTGSFKLGNDGTGGYKQNDGRYVFYVDDFNIFSGVLTAGEVSQIFNEAAEPAQITLTMTGAQSIAAGSMGNMNLHVQSNYATVCDTLTFRVNYDPAALEYMSYQHDKTTKVTKVADGVLELVYTPAALPSGSVKNYAVTRIIKLDFKGKEVAADTPVRLEFSDMQGTRGGEAQSVQFAVAGADMTVYARESLDKNGDGLVGAGDVALAEDQMKQAVAQAAGIYPYKRAVVITMDGGGNIWDETGASNVTGKPLSEVRVNPYAMNLHNNIFATSYSAQSMNPPISAQNYSSILHGVTYGDFPSEYKVDNDIAAASYWSDYGKDTALYPSMFKVVGAQQPRRGLATFNEWSPITNGIVEPDASVYGEYKYGKLSSDQLAAYADNGYLKNTALAYLQADTMDHQGHAEGYFNDAYFEKLKEMDAYFKTIVDALERNGLYEDTFLVSNTDHGGHCNANGTGSHGQPNNPLDMDIYIGVGGQTVDSGRKLSGGTNDDIAALVLSALRLEKAPSMSASTVFDQSMFLPQDQLLRKNRQVEAVTAAETGNTLRISLDNSKTGRDIRVADLVLETRAADLQLSTEGTVLKDYAEGGKRYLTLAFPQTPEVLAELTGASPLQGGAKVQEVMLGAADGTEIYCDLANEVSKRPVEQAYNQITLASVLGGNPSERRVSSDLLLPETAAGLPVTWSSSNTAVISNTGLVNPSAFNLNVELKAEVADGEERMSKTFTLTVPAGQAEGALLSGGVMEYAGREQFTADGFVLAAGTTGNSFDDHGMVSFQPGVVELERKTYGSSSADSIIIRREYDKRPEKGTYLMEFDLQQVNGAPLYIEAASTSSGWKPVFTIGIENDTLVVNANSSLGTITGVTNQRLNIKAVMRTAEEKMDLYVNGVKRYSGIAFRDTGGAGPERILFNCKGDSASKKDGGLRLYSLSLKKAYSSEMQAQLEDLNIRSLTAENSNQITQSLTLPQSGAAGYSIQWFSDKPEVISAQGQLTRPAEADQTVKLTATVQSATETATLTYLVTVLAEPPALRLQLLDEQGKQITRLEAEQKVKAAVTWSKAVGKEACKLILAGYDGQKLGELQMVEVNLTAAGGAETGYLTVPQGVAGYQVKAMLWDGAELTPVCEAQAASVE